MFVTSELTLVCGSPSCCVAEAVCRVFLRCVASVRAELSRLFGGMTLFAATKFVICVLLLRKDTNFNDLVELPITGLGYQFKPSMNQPQREEKSFCCVCVKNFIYKIIINMNSNYYK